MLQVLDVGREPAVSSIPKLLIKRNLWGTQPIKTKKENVEEDSEWRDIWLKLNYYSEGFLNYLFVSGG